MAGPRVRGSAAGAAALRTQPVAICGGRKSYDLRVWKRRSSRGSPAPVGAGGGKFGISFNCEDRGDLGGKTFAFVSDFRTFPSGPATPHHSPRALTTAGLGAPAAG